MTGGNATLNRPWGGPGREKRIGRGRGFVSKPAGSVHGEQVRPAREGGRDVRHVHAEQQGRLRLRPRQERHGRAAGLPLRAHVRWGLEMSHAAAAGGGRQRIHLRGCRPHERHPAGDQYERLCCERFLPRNHRVCVVLGRHLARRMPRLDQEAGEGRRLHAGPDQGRGGRLQHGRRRGDQLRGHAPARSQGADRHQPVHG